MWLCGHRKLMRPVLVLHLSHIWAWGCLVGGNLGCQLSISCSFYVIGMDTVQWLVAAHVPHHDAYTPKYDLNNNWLCCAAAGHNINGKSHNFIITHSNSYSQGYDSNCNAIIASWTSLDDKCCSPVPQTKIYDKHFRKMKTSAPALLSFDSQQAFLLLFFKHTQ